MDYGHSAYLSLFLDTDTSTTAQLTFRRFVRPVNTCQHAQCALLIYGFLDTTRISHRSCFAHQYIILRSFTLQFENGINVKMLFGQIGTFSFFDSQFANSLQFIIRCWCCIEEHIWFKYQSANAFCCLFTRWKLFPLTDDTCLTSTLLQSQLKRFSWSENEAENQITQERRMT